MSKRLEISHSTYYKNETAETFPGIRTLLLLHQNFNISMDWLLLGKGPMFYRDKFAIKKELTDKLSILKKELPDVIQLLQTLP